MSNTDSIKSPEAKHADEALQALVKAKRNLRLYPSNNPIYEQMAKDTYRKVMKYFDFADTMELTITRNEIKLGNETVFKAEGNEDNLALFLFRDGLRTLTITSALDEDEMLDLLEVLSTDTDKEDMEDLVTLLWEKDFNSIIYKVDESDLVDEDDNYEEVAEQQAKEGANEEEGIGNAYEEAEGDEDGPSKIVPVPVDEEDMTELARQVAEEHKSRFPKLVEILFDLLYTSDSVDEFRDVIDILSNAVDYCVRGANLAVAISIFRRAREVNERTKTPEARKELERLLALASSPDIIKIIGEWLDSKQGVKEKVFKEYVSILDARAIPPFISLLGELDTIGGRKAAIYALSVVGAKDFNALAKGLDDKRWFVARNVVLAFRSIGDKRANDYLPRVARHPEARVRKEALKLMGEIGGPSSVVHIKEQLYSDDPSVEIVAAQALSRIGTDSAKVSVLEKIMDKRFQEMELSGMKPFFEALARFRTVDVLDFLLNMLDKKPFFGRAKYNEMKACAIYSLGLMGSPKAVPVIEGQLESKDYLVREYASAALRRINNVKRK